MPVSVRAQGDVVTPAQRIIAEIRRQLAIVQKRFSKRMPSDPAYALDFAASHALKTLLIAVEPMGRDPEPSVMPDTTTPRGVGIGEVGEIQRLPEPGEVIARCGCPICGASLVVQHGDDPGEIGAIGTSGDPFVWLDDVLAALGWESGAVDNALAEVRRLRSARSGGAVTEEVAT